MGCCNSVAISAEKLVAARVTKRKLAADAKPITDTAEPEPPALAAVNDAWSAILATHLRPAAGPCTKEAPCDKSDVLKRSALPPTAVRFAAMDYGALAKDERFPALLKEIAGLTGVEAWPPAARAALYINAYNALCAEHICRHLRAGNGPPKSVRDLKDGSKEVWDRKAGTVAGEELSLNEIEHGVLRTRFDEPRVHACVNCASRSCPDLLGEAYRGDGRLDGQLTAQFELWLQDETKGLGKVVECAGVHTKRVCLTGLKPKLSRIFLWYAGDFAPTPGKFAGGFAPPGKAKDALLAGATPEYFDYDWNLNTQ